MGWSCGLGIRAGHRMVMGGEYGAGNWIGKDRKRQGKARKGTQRIGKAYMVADTPLPPVLGIGLLSYCNE